MKEKLKLLFCGIPNIKRDLHPFFCIFDNNSNCIGCIIPSNAKSDKDFLYLSFSQPNTAKSDSTVARVCRGDGSEFDYRGTRTDNVLMHHTLVRTPIFTCFRGRLWSTFEAFYHK